MTDGLTFGDADIRDLPQAELRSHIAYVPQKAWLFSGTIAENLRFGDEHADDAHLWHAIDVAQGAFVRELKDGLDTPVAQGGTNFSGGQRQRLAIARALTRHADLYIFDDSFSALDYKTDAALRHALKDELARAAVLIVAQRVSTIRNADTYTADLQKRLDVINERVKAHEKDAKKTVLVMTNLKDGTFGLFGGKQFGKHTIFIAIVGSPPIA